MNKTANFPFTHRGPDVVAITHKKGSFTVGEIIAQSELYLDEIHSFCLTEQRYQSLDEYCFVLPSTNPVTFLAGIIACVQAGVCVVPWRERTIDLEKITNSVLPDGLISFKKDHGLSGMSISPVVSQKATPNRKGNLVMMTSGSSGEPKGVALDVEKVVLNNLAAGTAMRVFECDSWSIDIDMALMSATCHMFMAWQFDLPLHHLEDVHDAELNAIFKSGNVGFGGSPIQLLKLTGRFENNVAPHMMASSGDFLSSAMVAQLKTTFTNTKIHKLYGLTELGGRFCCMPDHLLEINPGATGMPLPGFSMRLIDDGDISSSAEIEGYSPCRAFGYYFPDGTFKLLDKHWFSTGDLGSIDSTGALTLVGRSDDVIKVGGEKVDRTTIETALSDLLVRNEFCVLGVEHALVGQCFALFIAANDQNTHPTLVSIIDHMKHKVESRFIPALIYSLEMTGLPRLANGKIDRNLLKTNHIKYRRLTIADPAGG